jgi:heme A synthase
MTKPQHYRAFAVSVGWTLILLFLGSVVHATESSLACPDWPTCYGSWVPEMVGGVFWEHLHRLVAGGLILMFGLATWLAWREPTESRRWVVRASVAGVALLLVQAVFGGLTVIWRLPDAISTTHLGLALLFLGLAVVLAGATSPRRAFRRPVGPSVRKLLKVGGSATVVAVYLQSILGGYVRHSDAGMACGPGLLCNGGVLPPVFDHMVGLQYLHRILGITVAVGVVLLAWALLRTTSSRPVRRMAWSAVALVTVQVLLGFASTGTMLAVAPVSLHSLVAAGLLAVTVLMATWGWIGVAAPAPSTGSRSSPAPPAGPVPTSAAPR